MGRFLFSFFTASFISCVVGLLLPIGKNAGTQKYLRFLISLFLLLLLLSPLPNAMQSLFKEDFGNAFLQNSEVLQEEVTENFSNCSKSYILELLIQKIAEEFEISQNEMVCNILWEENTPKKVTLILSGKAIWKDPQALKIYVEELLHCDCTVAID